VLVGVRIRSGDEGYELALTSQIGPTTAVSKCVDGVGRFV